jgi:hypothetical protein
MALSLIRVPVDLVWSMLKMLHILTRPAAQPAGSKGELAFSAST